MNILHIAYSLGESSAATRLAEGQKNNVFFFLGRRSSYEFVRNKQVLPFISNALGVTLHLIEIIIGRLLKISKKEVFSFGLISIIQKKLIQRIVKVKKIDLIHLHWGGYGFAPLESFCNLGVPVVISAHDFHFFTGGCHVPMNCSEFDNACKNCPMTNSSIGKRVVAHKRKHNLDCLMTIKPLITTPSSYTHQKLINTYPFLTYTVIGNTLGLRYESTLSDFDLKDIYISSQNIIPTIISVGVKITERNNKGQDILKNVFTDLGRTGTKFNYISVGDYYEYQGPTKRVHFDQVDSGELAKLYAVSDICLVPSRFETFSQVTLESICSGTPVIAFDNSGPASIIEDKKTGFLVPSFDGLIFSNLTLNNLNFKRNNMDSILLKSIETNMKFSSNTITSSFDKVYLQSKQEFKLKM